MGDFKLHTNAVPCRSGTNSSLDKFYLNMQEDISDGDSEYGHSTARDILSTVESYHRHLVRHIQQFCGNFRLRRGGYDGPRSLNACRWALYKHMSIIVAQARFGPGMRMRSVNKALTFGS